MFSTDELREYVRIHVCVTEVALCPYLLEPSTIGTCQKFTSTTMSKASFFKVQEWLASLSIFQNWCNHSSHEEYIKCLFCCTLLGLLLCCTHSVFQSPNFVCMMWCIYIQLVGKYQSADWFLEVLWVYFFTGINMVWYDENQMLFIDTTTQESSSTLLLFL